MTYRTIWNVNILLHEQHYKGSNAMMEDKKKMDIVHMQQALSLALPASMG